MNAFTKTLYVSGVMLLLAGCGDNTNEEPENKVPEENTVSEQTPEKTTEEESATPMEEETEPEEITPETSEDALAEYSSKEIEYARVWLQLGPNQELDGLYVNHIPAGTPLNVDDETSGTYPEDVIQLAGSRLVDGGVTYSGNGNGTLNLYNVPLRWDGVYPAGKEFYDEIIANTELVAIDVGEDEEVIRLIELLKMEP
ncbi:putative lipoprotein [Planococcus donghaensis MPA1U2]|uniref:Putative lipoprotein n=1 Tax=Planococcus donghaensis MPA1U2 TaxID=933115 RepID=E7RKM0_9BACL|nr:hypothetical protein [Planococcus donghaensis]EGA88450.1 putative lipoprotein [Planococcus donghaensis MPA1U2]